MGDKGVAMGRDKDWIEEIADREYNTPYGLARALRAEMLRRVDELKKYPEYDYMDDGRKVEIIENIIHNKALSDVKEAME